MDDERRMARAIFLAERGRGSTAPNPLVGAVVVSPDGVVVGQGAHLAAGTPHAEVHALAMAAERARGATLYCTLEPCCHTGRTGPCVERVVAAGIRRVVAALEDPDRRVSGGGFAYLRAHGVEVEVGAGAREARSQNAPFVTWVTRQRPWVLAKAAVSADGFVGRASGRVKLTAAPADRWQHRQRAWIDAIAVGAGTILADDPLLTARGAYRARPLTRVIFDWRLRVPPTARVFSTLGAGPVIMIVLASAAEAGGEHLDALSGRGVIVERLESRRLQAVLQLLANREIQSLLVEGGPHLHDAFLEAGLVDRVQLIETAVRLGDGVPTSEGLLQALGPRNDDIGPASCSVRVLGTDRLTECDVHRID